MKLADIAFTSYIYLHMSDYDRSYCQFVDATKPQLDLHSKRHRMLLLRWLNQWGCRQFAKQHHSLAAQEIEEWYEEIGPQLFPPHKSLLSFTDEDFAVAEDAYTRLVGRTASFRQMSTGVQLPVRIGPTGTAKILFALRPNALPPWDEPICATLGMNGSAKSYWTYLQEIKSALEKLSLDCKAQGFGIDDLPAVLGRPEISVVKLIDEYYWATISRRYKIPSDSDYARWAAWSK